MFHYLKFHDEMGFGRIRKFVNRATPSDRLSFSQTSPRVRSCAPGCENVISFDSLGCTWVKPEKFSLERESNPGPVIPVHGSTFHQCNALSLSIEAFFSHSSNCLQHFRGLSCAQYIFLAFKEIELFTKHSVRKPNFN